MANKSDQNLWSHILSQDPEHSARYAARWEEFEAQGTDIDGEARLIDALAERGSRILDVGAGNGRTGGYLAAAGHDVVGIDLDAHLIEVAQQKYPQARWFQVDLEHVADSASDAAAAELAQPFDLAVSAGNVLAFLSEAGRIPALSVVFNALKSKGRFIAGFGLDRGYEWDQFQADARVSGFELTGTYSTWTLEPFEDQQGFVIAVLTKP